MAISIHLANSKGRDASVGLQGVSVPESPRLGLPDTTLVFRRYVAATEACTNESLTVAFGADYARELVNGDPEIDIELVGLSVERTQTVYVDGAGEVMFADPVFIELVLNPDGSEKERRAPVETVANLSGEIPVRWTGRKVSLQDAVRKFAFRRSVQLRHVDGLTYDFLFEMARELEEGRFLMLLGTGDKGGGPLVFQANGRPYRGFLEGQTRGKAYRLVLHLSDMELKKPATLPARGTSNG